MSAMIVDARVAAGSSLNVAVAGSLILCGLAGMS
jgi:hypothetical protein